MSKKSSFIQPLLKLKHVLTALMVVSILVLSSGVGEFISTNLFSTNLFNKNLFEIQPAVAQTISPGDVWQLVYQKLPDLPRENQYINKENGKVAQNNTLIGRLIQYHVYVKQRAPNYRLDWKLTLADYLGANEVMYETSYPGNDSLRKNPIEGDRTAIKRLNRRQRDALVQVLTNIFNPNSRE